MRRFHLVGSFDEACACVTENRRAAGARSYRKAADRSGMAAVEEAREINAVGQLVADLANIVIDQEGTTRKVDGTHGLVFAWRVAIGFVTVEIVHLRAMTTP